MPKLKLDQSKYALPENDGKPYPCKIVEVRDRTPEGIERVDFYFDVLEGEHAGVYEDVRASHNCFYMSYGNGNAVEMIRLRLKAIGRSNNFDAIAAFEADDFDKFINAKCGIIMRREITDPITEKIDTHVHAVVDYPKDYAAKSGGDESTAAPAAKDRYLPRVESKSFDNPIYVDERQKDGYHDELHDRLAALGIELQWAFLETGDYASDQAPLVFVDTKRGLQELANNFSPADRNRIDAEIARAVAPNGVIDGTRSMTILVTCQDMPHEASELTEYIRSWSNILHDTCGDCDGDMSRCTRDSGRPLDGEHIVKMMNLLSEKYPDVLHFVFVPSDTVAADYIADLLGYVPLGGGRNA